MLSKPISFIEYSDLFDLTASGEPEGVSLDYKGLLDGSDRDKKELAKDVSALANSQGGLLIVGVNEREARPVHPPTGQTRMLGQQKVEEWIDQVIVSNISPRVSATVRVLDLPDDPSMCLVAIQIYPSPRAPHMVTHAGDNRYYRRYFKRHQFQSMPAEEYEVRELFHRSARMRLEVDDFLESRGFKDVLSGNYGINQFSSRMAQHVRTGFEIVRADRATSIVAFTACPELFSAEAIPIQSSNYWDWMATDNRLYPPIGAFVPSQGRPVSHGSFHFVRDWVQPADDLLSHYLYILNHGYVESATSESMTIDAETCFLLVPIVARYWQFLRFVLDLYRTFGVLNSFEATLHLRSTRRAQLEHLGNGWDKGRRHPAAQPLVCMDDNIAIKSSFPSAEVSDRDLETKIRQAAADLDFAFGSRVSRAFDMQDGSFSAKDVQAMI